MVFERIPAETSVNPTVLGVALQFRNGRVAKNRFMKAAMTERIAVWDEDPKKRGIPTERIINMYEKWGNGGFGLILTGNVAVDPYHLEAAGNVIISRENDSPKLRENLYRFAQSTKSDGALAVVQLTHAGRQTPIGVYSTPFSASDVQLAVKGYLGFGKPVPLTLEQIKTEVIDRFVYSAKIAYEAGFDGVQLHGAHGYLLSQFMSPTTNKRTDQYGGSPENRVRIVLEIFDAIRKEIPAETGFLIGIKTNSVEFQEQGLQTNDAKIMCRLMEEKGFDFVELSGGTMEKFAFSHERESTKKREAFFLEFTDQIKPVFKRTIVYVTGGFRTVSGMTLAVENGSTDGIGLGRPVAAEPDLPKKILSGVVASSSDDKLQQDDFGLTAIAAMSQMAAMGKRSLKELNGRVEGDIPDFSNPQESKNYLERFAEHMAFVGELIKEQKPVPGVLEYTALEVAA